MRVVTFQNSDVIDSVLKTDVFIFNGRRKSNRIKEIDLLENKSMFPIYGFISIPHNGVCGIHLPAIYYRWSYLVGYMGLDGRDMLELEVPDKYIGTIRTVNANIELSYMEAMSYTNDEVEVVLYEIRKEWVVSVHKAKNNDKGYNLRCIKVNIINSNIISICNDSYRLSGDGYAETNIFEKLPDKLYRPVRYGDLKYFVNPTCYNNISLQLCDMYELNTDYSINDLSKRFSDVLIY